MRAAMRKLVEKFGLGGILAGALVLVGSFAQAIVTALPKP